MDDLVRWLGEQLDKDAARAEEAAAARGGHWSAQSWQNGRHAARHYVGASAEAGVVRSDSEIMTGGAAVVRHAAAHDPARVLREIDAKRKIVQLLAETIEAGENYKGPDYYDGVNACERTLELLALPYADRPGYRAEWAPSE